MADVKIELDSKLHCERCNANPYFLYRRQVQPGSEVWENVLWPGDNGTPPPVQSPRDICCPRCDGDLKRVSA